MKRALVVGVTALCLFSGAASASPVWAGLTEAQAVLVAKRGVISIGLALGTLTPRTAKALRHELDQTVPNVKRVTCRGGVRMWKILWPKSDPAYVNSSGLHIYCRG